MIFIGLSLIWIVIVLYFHPQLIKTIHNIRSNENKRLDHLKKDCTLILYSGKVKISKRFHAGFLGLVALFHFFINL